MKRLSTLISLVLIATIGCVYASWTYVNNTLKFDTYSEKAVAMATVEESNTINGAYTLVSNFSGAEIDQNKSIYDSNADYHKAILVPAYSEGDALAVSVKFKPSEIAEATVKDYGITTYLWIDFTVEAQFPVDSEGYYDENGTATDIFNFKYNSENYITIHPVGTDLTPEQVSAGTHFIWEAGTGEDEGSFVVDIMDDIADLVTLNNFVLDNATVNGIFGGIINSGAIRCTVSNKTPSEHAALNNN